MLHHPLTLGTTVIDVLAIRISSLVDWKQREMFFYKLLQEMHVRVDIKEVYFSLICSTQLLLVPTKCMSTKRRWISVIGTMNTILWMINEMIVYNKAMFYLECVVALFVFLSIVEAQRVWEGFKFCIAAIPLSKLLFLSNQLNNLFLWNIFSKELSY